MDRSIFQFTRKQLPRFISSRYFRIMEHIRLAVARTGVKYLCHEDGRSIDICRLSKLIHKGKNGNRNMRVEALEKLADVESRTKVSVISWDLGHNPLGRAYLLADVLRCDYDVELIGASFPRFGNEVWEPLRDCSRVTIKSFPGASFPRHFKHMEDIAEQIDGDVIYVSKPRLPSLELAILAKLQRNRPVILDVDDYELGFFKNREPLTINQVKRKRHKADFICPHDETWTRYSESLIALFEQVTVSNEELRKKFGGMILPHIRDEYDFIPTAYPREALRTELGFTRDDKIILFAGTPRMHKGLTRVTAAMKGLNRPDYKLLIVGSSADNHALRFFNNKHGHVKCLPNVPFYDLPGYLCIGDLICLLQLEGQVTSQYQIPAKFTDGLSMGIPMLATKVPPLVNLAAKGLVELLDDIPLEHKIDDIFSNYEVYKQKAMKNRQVFLREYSYRSNLPNLKRTITHLLNNPAPIPDEFLELVAYHRRIFSNSADSPRVTAKVMANGRPASVLSLAVTPDQAPVVRAQEDKSYIDDKMDIVFFWKQNDTGIYGRRQDMLVKYLGKDPRIHRILHFDAPISLIKSGRDALTSTLAGSFSHAWLIIYKTLRRKLRLEDKGKVHFDTFIFAYSRYVPRCIRWMLPFDKNYLDFLERKMAYYRIGQRRTIFWVYPNNFDFPLIADRFKPDLIVADIVDDQRKWPCDTRYRKRLHHNYKDILVRSNIAIVNCRNVLEGMKEFTNNIHLIPNACEFLEEEARNWKKPAELRRIKGPVIGYVGNLDITRIDLDLLMRVAAERPDWSLVFIGSMHKNKKIIKLNKFRNVHFLGVHVYEQAVRYIRHFDVAMIPHLDNDLTRNMNPLKLYVYFSLHVPVVTTPIANIEDFGEFIHIGRTPEEFIKQIGYCLDNNPISGNLERIRNLLKTNSWNERVTRLLILIEGEFARRERSMSSGSLMRRE